MTPVHPLEAELVVEPAPTATSVAWKLWWRLAIGEGVHGAGPAGPAGLRLRDGGAVIWTDYAEPARLLQLDVPFGVVTGDDDDELLLAKGRIDDADAEVVDRLLGAAVRERLVLARRPVFTASVPPVDAWAVAGRAALIETMLDERFQPVAGLWAIELEGILDSLRAGRSSELRRKELVGVGAAAARLLPMSLATDIARTPQLADLLKNFATRNVLDVQLIEALRAPAAAEVLDNARVVIDTAAEEISRRGTTERGIGVEVPSSRGGPTRRPEPVCLRDYSIDGIVETIEAVLDGDELEVRLELVDPVVGATQHLDVRVTGPDGLLAVAASFERLDSRRLRSRLLLPAAMPPYELVVVAGRRLPFAPLDRDSFDERQAVARTRRLVDALRTAPGSSELFRKQAADAWRDAGRPDLAVAAEELEAQTPFVTELTAAALRSQITAALRLVVTDGADDDEAAAARGIAWSLGDLKEAARFEKRRRSQPGTSPLPAEHHDALVLGLLVSGETAEARTLDAQRPVLV